jgi:hypothetical protein
MAYPGSRLYDDAVGHEGVLPDTWEGFSQHGYLAQPLPTKHLTAEEVLQFRDQAFSQYHSHPRYLEMMEEKFGACVTEHLQRMLSITLKRNLLTKQS